MLICPTSKIKFWLHMNACELKEFLKMSSKAVKMMRNSEMINVISFLIMLCGH